MAIYLRPLISQGTHNSSHGYAPYLFLRPLQKYSEILNLSICSIYSFYFCLLPLPLTPQASSSCVCQNKGISFVPGALLQPLTSCNPHSCWGAVLRCICHLVPLTYRVFHGLLLPTETKVLLSLISWLLGSGHHLTPLAPLPSPPSNVPSHYCAQELRLPGECYPSLKTLPPDLQSSLCCKQMSLPFLKSHFKEHSLL